MSRCIYGLVLGLVVSLFAQDVQAGPLRNLYWFFVDGTHRNAAWPMPYVIPDRKAAMAPFHTLIANGWRRQNLVSDHHFDRETGELTKAGQLKIHWILTQAPPERRTIFVQRGMSSDVTADRIDEIQKLAVELVPEGGLPSVEETHLLPEGTPADRVDAMFVRFRESAPTPQLPTFESSIEQ